MIPLQKSPPKLRVNLPRYVHRDRKANPHSSFAVFVHPSDKAKDAMFVGDFRARQVNAWNQLRFGKRLVISGEFHCSSFPLKPSPSTREDSTFPFRRLANLCGINRGLSRLACPIPEQSFIAHPHNPDDAR